MEYELLDTGVFRDNRYFDVFVEYAKGAAEDILVRITAANRGPEAAELHLLPTLWFRNDWSKWIAESNRATEKPHLEQIEAPAGATAVSATHHLLGAFILSCEGDDAAALHRERNEPRAAVSRAEATRAPTSRTASTTAWCTAGRTR